jgi:hypothetical protein
MSSLAIEQIPEHQYPLPHYANYASVNLTLSGGLVPCVCRPTLFDRHEKKIFNQLPVKQAIFVGTFSIKGKEGNETEVQKVAVANFG